MAIKRWVVEADTTVTNAYKENLNDRGSLGNMGAADSLEVFSLHGQSAASGAGSKEAARILIRPDVLSIRSAIENGDIPNPDATNKPTFYLRLFNAPHPESLPVNLPLKLYKLDEAFEEGNGVDMSNYSDIGAANWTNKSDTASAAGVGKLTVIENPTTNFIINIDGEETSVTPGPSANDTATAISVALGGSSKVSPSPAVANAVTITAQTNGSIGNYAYSVEALTGSISTDNFYMTGGNDYTAWTTAMDVDTGPFTDVISSLTLEKGTEDLVIDVTDYVEDAIWNSGTSQLIDSSSVVNNGFLLKIDSESTAKTYYTKKFFARSSEFFFKRPTVEARWNNSFKDSRGKFYAKKPYMSNNTQTVYLYNFVDGELTDLNLTGINLYFSLYTTSNFVDDEGTSTVVQLDVPGDDDVDFVQASKVSTGVYMAQAAVATSESTLYERWYVSTNGTANITEVQSASIAVNQPTPNLTVKSEQYIFSITNLKPTYTRSEKPRFRLYSRLKDWSPTIYTVANKAIENKIVDNVYYPIFRATDDEVVVGYGIGSSDNNHNHTLLSYDKDGNYFDFDMSMLQAGYMYGIKLATYVNGEIVEHEKAFKFRVD